MRTGVSPACMNPRRFAAPMLTSSTRLPTNGPRSVTSSTSFRPFSRLVTRTWVPSGSFRCAQVKPCILKGCPLAVGSPWNAGPYQLATPNCVFIATVEFAFGVFISGGLASDEAHMATRAAKAQPIAIYLNCPSLFFSSPISLTLTLTRTFCPRGRNMSSLGRVGRGCQGEKTRIPTGQ